MKLTKIVCKVFRDMFTISILYIPEIIIALIQKYSHKCKYLCIYVNLFKYI